MSPGAVRNGAVTAIGPEPGGPAAAAVEEVKGVGARLKLLRAARPSLLTSPAMVMILRLTTLDAGPGLPATSRSRAWRPIEPLLRSLGRLRVKSPVVVVVEVASTRPAVSTRSIGTPEAMLPSL